MRERRPSLHTTTFFVVAEMIVIVTRDRLNNACAITLSHSISSAKCALDERDSTAPRKDTLRLSEQLELALSDDGDIPEVDPRPNISMPTPCVQRFDELLLKGLETLEANRGQPLDSLFERTSRDQDLGACHVSAGVDEDSCLLLLYALRGQDPVATLIMSASALRALLIETSGTPREGFYRSLEPMFPRLARARGASTPVHLGDALAKILIIGALTPSPTLSASSFQNEHLTN